MDKDNGAAAKDNINAKTINNYQKSKWVVNSSWGSLAFITVPLTQINSDDKISGIELICN